jgi:signal transduction histidine kinase
VDIEPVTTGQTDAEKTALLASARFFADRQVYGLVWIDRDLIARARYGDKAAFVAIGRPIADSVFPLIGSEAYIESFQTDPLLTLELPGVVIVSSADTQERYNLSLFWAPEQQHYLLLIARASLDATLEIELLRHVRARLMAEAETKAKSEALARANRDLEDFAGIVSHDLKAPMRALQYMTDEVDAALARGSLNAARAQLEWIRGQTRRMTSMLTGLLDYSSIGRKHEAIETTDTLALAETIAAAVPHGAGMTVSIEGTWPVIDTLKAPLDLVLRNLVDNAIKHHDRATGLVRLACVAAADSLLISVADDGPGIAAEHRDVIFLPFRTLAVPDSNPAAGVGLGLALVQRTVEGAGGSIRVVSDRALRRGCTFEVSWPLIVRT